jgi:hypothetical protein
MGNYRKQPYTEVIARAKATKAAVVAAKAAPKTGIDEIENLEPEAVDDFDPQAEWGTWNKTMTGVK